MAIARHPFISFEATGPARPLVPVDFPIGKSVYCLVDSGASTSLMSVDVLLHEKKTITKSYGADYQCEGICGNECLSLLGVSEPIPLVINGLTKPITMEFNIVGKQHKLDYTVFGSELFEQVSVSFIKEKGNRWTIINE